MILKESDFDEKSLIVVVNKYWDPSRGIPSLEDCARGYWRVGRNGMAYQCRWLLASYHGEVVGVWEIAGGWLPWPQRKKSTWPDDRPKTDLRRACDLVEAPTDIKARYLHESTSGLIRPRAWGRYVGF